MKAKPMTMLLAMLARWINREQQQIIEYLKTENSILRDELVGCSMAEKTSKRAANIMPTAHIESQS